ncbi:hypothetical protein GCK72_007504 [Caenorhabditis remanei]|uniref:Uncharacterized protein n=1 Tax=Caenorhabditis remanei TaxID=31234 RepID=A0A6A5HJ82_CAERE|nr:hypothetical protein GCK72_007504 [Caenorhabditis remanei]KAF1767545.1 hypothetical protein GCK72_007504 [Caenorhabditis remanei]
MSTAFKASDSQLPLLDDERYKVMHRHLEILVRNAERIPESVAWPYRDPYTQETRELAINDYLNEWRRHIGNDTEQVRIDRELAILQVYEERFDHFKDRRNRPQDLNDFQYQLAVLDGIFTAWDNHHRPTRTLPRNLMHANRNTIRKELFSAVHKKVDEMAKARKNAERDARANNRNERGQN